MYRRVEANHLKPALTDVALLSELPHLTQVDVSGNRIAQLDAVAMLPRLTTLRAASNVLERLPPAPASDDGTAGCLVHLDVRDNAVRSLNGVADNAALRVLLADNNRIASLAALPAGLQTLSLNVNRLPTLHFPPAPGMDFARFALLATLAVDGNRLESLDGIAALPNLRVLSARDNMITTLMGAEGIAACAQLEKIDLSNNRVADVEQLEAFAGHTALAELSFMVNPLAARDAYRNEVLALLPHLLLLDQVKVSPEEKVRAQLFKERCENEAQETLALTARSEQATAREIQKNRIEALLDAGVVRVNGLPSLGGGEVPLTGSEYTFRVFEELYGDERDDEDEEATIYHIQVAFVQYEKDHIEPMHPEQLAWMKKAIIVHKLNLTPVRECEWFTTDLDALDAWYQCICKE